MPFDGTGVFRRTANWLADAAAGVGISPSKFDADGNDVAAALSDCILRDGTGKPTADIPWNSRRITGLGSPQALTDACDMKTAAGFSSVVNKIRNATFFFNQRGQSSPITLAAGAKGFDGWRAGASGCTYSWVTTGTDTVVTITAGTLQQIIRGTDVEAGNYVLSWTGTAVGRILQSGNQFGYQAAPLLATNIVQGIDVFVEWGTGTLSLPQMQTGAIVTPFQRRSIELERAIVTADYQLLRLIEDVYCSTTAGVRTPFTFPKMNAVPTATLGINVVTNQASGYPQVTILTDTSGYVTVSAAGAPGISSYDIFVTLSAEE